MIAMVIKDSFFSTLILTHSIRL